MTTMGPASNSSSGSVGLLEKLRYNFGLLAIRLKVGNDSEARARQRIAEIHQFIQDFERTTGKRASESAVVEIGFGARPERAFALSAFFRTVHAIDLDAPMLSSRDLPRIFAKNGFERGIKSTVRHFLFDRRAWKQFHKAMIALLPGYDPAKTNLVVGNAGDAATWAGLPKPDLVLSVDVFEHIPPADLRTLLNQLHDQLADGGMIITRPMVFTGISGGHDLEWYPFRVNENSSETAWGHLVDPDFRVNTYVNRLGRRDFREMFEAAGFEVIKDFAQLGDFGRAHLTAERREKLAGWDDYELFSNEVVFQLRRA